MTTTAAPRSTDAEGSPSFWSELHTQRWDDHRYYHRSRVNQALHLLSACCFVVAYLLIPFQAALAAILGWVVAMWVRQIGHFFFEPRGFDEVNHATFAHKEEIKLGYNLRRKVVLLAIWITVPFMVWRNPTMFGTMERWTDAMSLVNQTGLLWLWLGVAGLLARTLWLALTHSPKTGFVWMIKILTDPFHDISIYYKAPAALLRGEWIDPMTHVQAFHGSTPNAAAPRPLRVTPDA